MSAEPDILVCPIALPSTIPLSRHTPRCLADASLSFAPASTMRVIYRVHGHASYNRPPPQPSGCSSLAYLHILMLRV